MSSDDIDECISALSPWDVIWPYDEYIVPPKCKMWVCISKENLWFLRINSECYHEYCAALLKDIHPWLEHDSFMGCAGQLVNPISEKTLKRLLARQNYAERQGILGSIDQSVRAEIIAKIQLSGHLASKPKEIIRRELSS